jgi:hypothetical protein
MRNMKGILLSLSIVLAFATPALAQFAAQQTWQATTTGTANAIVIGIPDVSSISDLVGVPIRFLPASTNNGPATASVGGTAATAIKKATQNGLTPLAGQEMVAGQVTKLIYDGTEYVLDNTISPQPIIFTNTTYCVAASGNDSNSGQTGSCWLTLQHAANFISQYNANGFTITVNVGTGTYAAVNLLPVGGNGFVSWVGNASTPANVIISSSTTSAVSAFGVTGQSLNGFTLASTSSSPADSLGACVYAASQSSLTISNIVFGTCYGDAVFSQQSNVNLGAGTIAVSGSSTGQSCNPGCGAILDANYGGFIAGTSSALAINASISVVSFIAVRSAGFESVHFTSITNPGSVTGLKFTCVLNGVIESLTGGNLSYYPGSSAGTQGSGCQYQ